MDGQMTNPAGEAPATPPPAGAGAEASTGSQFRPGMLVSVPHPGIQEDQPGQGAGSGEDVTRTGPAPAGQESPGTTPAAGAEAGASQGRDGGQVPAPFKTLDYKGRQVPVKDEAELIRLAQQGLDYTVKTQVIAPHLNDLRALAALRADPAKAAQLQALLTGQAAPAGEGAPGQAPPPAAKLPVIYVRDGFGNIVRGEDGQPMQADPTFVHAIKDYVDALGLADKPAQSGLPPEMAVMVTQAQVGRVAAYVKETYGREDFTAAIPMIQEAMVAQGIGQGDPRDCPDTWLTIYNHLALTNRLPVAGQAASAAPAAGGGRPTSQRTNKSEIKVAAQTAAPSTTRDRGKDLDAAIKRAKEQGSSNAWRSAVGLAISHPDLGQGA